MEIDRISSLPGDIINKILSEVSLRDAVRTSVLSSKWRYKWITLPHLIFDHQCVSVPSQDPNSQDHASIKSKLVKVVTQVLMFHTGPILKFSLCHPHVQGYGDIDLWIRYLSFHSVEEFILYIGKDNRYELPSSLYSCQNLTHLELFNCLLKPPSTFKGFRSVKSLDLQLDTLDQDVFDRLISGCPLLERLTLDNCGGFTLLNIDAPNLQFFVMEGIFDGISFENTFHLATVSIGMHFCPRYDQKLTFGNTGNLIKFFAHLPSVQRLKLEGYFLKYLAIGKIPGRLPIPCMELKYLSMCIYLNDMEESLTALCILSSSPNLQELVIWSRPKKETALGRDTNIWEDHYNCPFKQLRLVKLAKLSGSRCELDFINFLLENSPVLERMTVQPATNDSGWGLLKELVRFRRDSKWAEIIYLDA